MAVATTAPLPKSQPDISKLNTFTGYIVTVTKHLGPRGTVGTGVISSKVMTKEALLALPEQLPSLPGAGPGYYAFTVTDAGGTGDDTWLVKLGPDMPPQQELPMAGSNGVTPGGFSGAPPALGEGVIHLGHNFFYNEAMGTLTTPWRTIVSWKQGDPMPQPPTSAATAPSFTLPAPPSTPWGAPQMGGWGGYPVSDDAKTKQLEAEIARLSREREMSDIRAEQRRVQDDTNKRIEQQSTMFTQMFERLTAAISEIGKTPKGPSDEVVMLRQQIESDRREREAERREATTREEIRRNKEDTDRMLRELNANKSDPMLTMVMTVMQQSNASAMEAVKAIQTSTGNANTSSERQVQSLVEQLRSTIISPMQMMEMMRASRGDGADMAKTMIETMKESSAMQREVYGQLLEVAGQGGNPPWVTAIEAIANRVGPIGEAIANRANQPKVVERVVRVAVPVDPATGRPIQQQQPAAGAVNGAPVQGAVPAANGVPAGATASVASAQPDGTVVTEQVSVIKPKKKKGEAAPQGLTMRQVGEMDPNELAKLVSAKAMPDKEFFGPQLMQYIPMIRDQVKSGATAEQAAEFLLRERNNLIKITPMPPAVELFLVDQISVLVERILPDVDEEYHGTVVQTIEAQIMAEREKASASEAETETETETETE